MLFAPRHLPNWRARLRVALWPRRSWSRSARYIGWRVLRLGGSPEGLALGVAIGVFIATLPIPGAQMLTAVLVAWLIGGNVPAALLGTFWANPLTLPILWLGAHWLGSTLLGQPAVMTSADLLAQLAQVKSALLAPGRETLAAAYEVLWPLFKPLAIGALPLAAISAAVFYGLTVHLIAGYRERHRATRLRVGRSRGSAVAMPLEAWSHRQT